VSVKDGYPPELWDRENVIYAPGHIEDSICLQDWNALFTGNCGGWT
jgi:glyoxylase-like metal-dependent hydrolase (beta-lactamase superfamily II)